jgi:hypothetical protein
MATINEIKELKLADTPLFLVDLRLSSGDSLSWSTHKVTVAGTTYQPRVVAHNLFELKSASEDGTDGLSRVAVTLANADSELSPVERSTGWKGAQVTIRFLFFDLKTGTAASESRVIFRGVANPPEESNEATLRLSFTNRLSLQRVLLPEARIQKRCPWAFPTTAAQREEAKDGGAKGKFSPFYRCGYSAGVAGGVGSLNGGVPFDACDFTRAQCEQRGMFDKDTSGAVTRRFGGIEFVPASILVRSYGEKGSHTSPVVDNQARYSDYVPLIYGTGWYLPLVVFARNDGNLTRMEVLLGAGEMTDVLKVIVNGIEIPAGVPNANMTATGWYNVVSLGSRSGAFNTDFTDSSGHPLGDPYGSMALVSVVVPNRISDGLSLPRIEVLTQGLKLATFDTSGNAAGDVFTNNPAWVLLDVLRRSRWLLEELDVASFAAAAARCDELVPALDLNGNSTMVPRYQCNMILTKRRSAADVARGIRTGSGLYLTYSSDGLLQARVEDSLARQQSSKSDGSNSTAALNDGWPAYEFGDNAISGILRRGNGQASFRTWARASADTPNRLTVEFQDEFNEYQQDSLSLVDLDDSLQTGQEVNASLTALGIPNFDQATRIATRQLNRSIEGNMYVDFETSVRSVHLRPGDLIAITYSKEGWARQPFRVVRIAPGQNYRTAAITAQIHDDGWYADGAAVGGSGAGRQPRFGVGVPRPLVGSVVDSDGNAQFDIHESQTESTDGTVTVALSVGFVSPARGTSAALGVPLAGLNPRIDTTGGSLAGFQTLYYALSAVDALGEEGALSFTIKASIPAATNTNQITLQNLSFSTTATAFNVYRGTTPAQLLRITSGAAIATSFTDTGLNTHAIGPPDINYDHANFSWRMELQPEETVDIHSDNSIGNSTLAMLANELRGATVRITKGIGAGQERSVASNTTTAITVTSKWDIEPDNSSSFVVAEGSWQFGASGAASPISFDVPNREGATVHISGRSANVRDQECAYELSPLTRWRISGGSGTGLDGDIPGTPTFGISPTGQGSLEVVGIGFSDLTNTTTINAGTLTLAYWNELNGPSTTLLSAAAAAADTSIHLSVAGGGQAGDLVQIESEVMVIEKALDGGLTYQVTRGSHGSTAADHAAQTAVYLLQKKTFVMAFARNFFGSPASGSYAYAVHLPDARLAAAELFLTNSRGGSGVARRAFTSTVDLGLRTLSGGQLSIQIEGLLAIQTDAAPPLVVESSHSIRDVFAVVRTAPTGSPIQLQVTQNGQLYCGLTIPIGARISNVADGFALGPLQVNAQIGLNIISVSQTSGTLPGSDLTVTIRL